MRLHTLSNAQPLDILSEAPRKPKSTQKIECPFGISPEDFTDEYQAHLADIRDRRPELFQKIMLGL